MSAITVKTTMKSAASDSDSVAKLIPRAYQEEVFTRAQYGNIIAALDTGSGKTFIAALLIKWITSLPEVSGKKVVFLVPKVPLVDQQREFLSCQTPLEVRGYIGAMNVDSWGAARWAVEFKQADVLIMTPQIFRDVLMHAYWSMRKVSLLIFDECHHARGNHMYNQIMRDHYVPCTVDDRPNIFGMTASPVWNVKNPAAALQELKWNMFASIVAVKQHVDELKQHAPKPTEILECYPPSPSVYPTYNIPSLIKFVEEISMAWTKASFDLSSVMVRYDVTLKSVGPYGADYYLHNHLTSSLSSMQSVQTNYLSGASAYANYNGVTTTIGQAIEGDIIVYGNRDVYTTMASVISRFGDYLHEDFKMSPDWLSPKVQAMVRILQKYRSPTFHCIIFVEQRQVAATLSWLLMRHQDTKDWVRSAVITGHGGISGNDALGMSESGQKHVVKKFREGELNLLVATAVAEEGLDFPACELVIRFDTLKTMVGYVQSRGRARNQASNFVVLIEEGDTQELTRFRTYQESEPELKRVYQSSAPISTSIEEESEVTDPVDLAQREVYVVPSTGAMLTYGSAIELLNNLCSLIYHDEYTTPHQPKYIGDFKVKLILPGALPLDDADYVYEGPEKHTKKEAKRAVAFIAARRLHQLGVLDDHLRASKQTKGIIVDDADDKPLPEVNAVSVMMDVLVVDPWRLGPPFYSHILSLDGQPSVAFVNGTQLPDLEFVDRGMHVSLRFASELHFNDDEQESRVELMDKFTRLGIWWGVTGSPINTPLSCYLLPLAQCGASIDWMNMEQAVAFPFGDRSWSGIDDSAEGSLMIMNAHRYGHPALLRRVRHDLRFSDKPISTTIPGEFSSYASYFNIAFTASNLKYIVNIDEAAEEHGDVILETVALKRRDTCMYPLDGVADHNLQEQEQVSFHPRSLCKWSAISPSAYRSFHILSQICQRSTDLYRAHSAITSLNLPPLLLTPTISALTIPSATAGFSNQRLETLGDSVLKLSVVVYVYNKYPRLHEGQLDRLKTNSVSNRALLARAREVGLERFVVSEARRKGGWRFEGHEGEVVLRRYPRRSLQDCMEALLGASFVSGGIPVALQTGTALGLCFGGTTPWGERYGLPEEVPPAPLFNKLQALLGYTFRNGRLLVQAMTHNSFQTHGSGASTYQRLEFLGDALIEMVVSNYLYDKFSSATSAQLSNARQHVVCNSVLAAIAVKKLSLHKYILANNIELSKSVASHAEHLLSCSYEEIVPNKWRFDPPKVLGDVLESLVGAVLVDSGYDYDKCVVVLEGILREVLEMLHPDMPGDPVAGFMIWLHKTGCTKAKFHRAPSDPRLTQKDTVSVYIHSRLIVGPLKAKNISLAKGLASSEAQRVLHDPSSPFHLSKICDCMKVDVPAAAEEPEVEEVEKEELDDETEEGFALNGRILASEAAWKSASSSEGEGGESGYESGDEESEQELEIEEGEVEMLLQLYDDNDDCQWM